METGWQWGQCPWKRFPYIQVSDVLCYKQIPIIYRTSLLQNSLKVIIRSECWCGHGAARSYWQATYSPVPEHNCTSTLLCVQVTTERQHVSFIVPGPAPMHHSRCMSQVMNNTCVASTSSCQHKATYIKETTWKGKYQSMDITKKGKTLTKKWRDFWRKGIHKHTETYSRHTWCHLYHMFTYIYSLLIKKDICNFLNISNKFLCVYVCLSSDLFILQ